MHVSWARNMTASLVSAGIRHCIRLLGRVIMCASSRGLPIGGNPKGKRPSYPVELVRETRTSSPVRIAPDPTSRMHSRASGPLPVRQERHVRRRHLSGGGRVRGQRCCSTCPLMARLPSSRRWPQPSNGGTRGRQVTQVERARPEAEKRRKGPGHGRSEVEARHLQPPQAGSGEEQKVSACGERSQPWRPSPTRPGNR